MTVSRAAINSRLRIGCIPRDSPSDENRELYGKCNNPHGHGHDYVLEVRVAGPLDPVSGQVVNVAALDRLVAEQVIEDFDYKYLNVGCARVPERDSDFRKYPACD